MSLADTWQLDPETIEWHRLALCDGVEFDNHTENPFFEAYESNTRVAKSTDQICLHCPVLKQCFKQGTEDKESGVWGGFYLDRGKIDKNKNAHKTDEIRHQLWEALSE